MAHGAEQRHAQLPIRGKLVLEESGREQGEAARAVGHGDEPLRGRGGYRRLAGIAPCLRGDGRTDHAAELAAGHGRDPRHTGRHAEPEPVVVSLATTPTKGPAVVPRVVPDVRGMSLRDAVRTLHSAGFRVRYSGSASARILAATFPAAGSVVRQGSLIRLVQ